ncbi:MAG: hypothetical protein J6K14_04320 [Clostridia bacterium]|nr:hypothetical protein [Clostridia bacterium]
MEMTYDRGRFTIMKYLPASADLHPKRSHGTLYAQYREAFYLIRNLTASFLQDR